MVQFQAGGHAYVYLCYGINIMLNVVADKAGVGAAVLIRACSPVHGKYINICNIYIYIDYYYLYVSSLTKSTIWNSCRVRMK